MTAPTHHLDDDVLLDYVTGAASEPVALVVACHLTLCAACRAHAAAAETVGGALLDRGPAVALSENVFERVLARLGDEPSVARAGDDDDDDDALGNADVSAPFVFADVPLPRPLARYLDHQARTGDHARAFRFLAPGVRGIDLATSAPAGVRARLLRLAAGVSIPRHTHAGPEFTLVFAGGLSDGGQHYVRGDVRFRDTSAEHIQVVDADSPCIALVVNEGALVPSTWRGRIASFLFDR